MCTWTGFSWIIFRMLRMARNLPLLSYSAQLISPSNATVGISIHTLSIYEYNADLMLHLP